MWDGVIKFDQHCLVGALSLSFLVYLTFHLHTPFALDILWSQVLTRHAQMLPEWSLLCLCHSMMKNPIKSVSIETSKSKSEMHVSTKRDDSMTASDSTSNEGSPVWSFLLRSCCNVRSDSLPFLCPLLANAFYTFSCVGCVAQRLAIFYAYQNIIMYFVILEFLFGYFLFFF